MQQKIDLLKLANMNKKLDVDLVRSAEKQATELKRLGLKVDPEFRVQGPFEGKSSFRFQTTK